jgi:hypothetical protein
MRFTFTATVQKHAGGSYIVALVEVPGSIASAHPPRIGYASCRATRWR